MMIRSWKGLTPSLAFLGALVLAAGPNIAPAETYIGASYGWTDGGGSDYDFEDSTSSGWRAFLGATAGGVFGWEVGYVGISDFKGRELNDDVDLALADVTLLAGLPVGPVRLFGKVGAAYGMADVGNRSSDDWGYTYGVGGDVLIGKNFGLRFEWGSYTINSDLTNLEVDIASAGVMFRF